MIYYFKGNNLYGAFIACVLVTLISNLENGQAAEYSAFTKVDFSSK